jgi:ribosomal protein S18 acetylase RimI-like enzyme
VVLRLFEPEHLGPVMALVTDTFEQIFSQDMYMAIQQAWPEGQIIDLEGGRIVGVLLSMRRSLDQGRVLVMAVEHPHRGTGIGSGLLSAFLQQCSREGITSVALEVRVSNLRAQGFYRRFGFTEVGPLPSYYPDGEDGVLMTRNVV